LLLPSSVTAPATTQTYALPLHDALPIYTDGDRDGDRQGQRGGQHGAEDQRQRVVDQREVRGAAQLLAGQDGGHRLAGEEDRDQGEGHEDQHAGADAQGPEDAVADASAATPHRGRALPRGVGRCVGGAYGWTPSQITGVGLTGPVRRAGLGSAARSDRRASISPR